MTIGDSSILRMLELSFKKEINSLIRNFPDFCSETNLRANIWSNRYGIIQGAISYYPHNDPSEESVDLVFDFQKKKNKLFVTIDVVWSDGRVIKEIVKKDLEFMSDIDLQERIKKIIDSEMDCAVSIFHFCLLNWSKID